jgi:RNA polymerase sigma-70 factor (ECF subfamily)
MRVLRDPELGRDAEQEVYATAWLKLSQLRVAERFLHWIRRIARNQAVRSLRIRVRERAQVGLDAALATYADASPFPLDRLVDAETRAALYAAVASLPPTSREVILLHYRDGRPLDQVAEHLGIRTDAVRQRLSRARTALRRALSARS